MNKFEHNGIKITLTDDGKFSANVNGEAVTKGTLAAIKKAIGGVEKFEPFPAISITYGDVPRKVVVTSISVPRATWRGKAAEYRCSYKSRTGQDERAFETTLFADTAENLAAFEKLVALRTANTEAKNAIEEQYETERMAIIEVMEKLPAPQDHPAYKKETP